MPFYGTVLGKQKITLCFASYPSRVGNWGVPQFALPIARRSWQTVCQNIPWPIGSMTLSSPPVAGVWWAHTLDRLYDSLSSPPVAGVWWAHTLDRLYDSLSSPPVAGVWWAHWCRCPVAAVASSKWMLHTGGGSGETPPPPPLMILKHFGCTTIHKALYKMHHSFIQ